MKSQSQGYVIDGKDNSPLSGVNIYLQKDSVGIGVTDKNGYFNIEDVENIAIFSTSSILQEVIRLFSRMWDIFLLNLPLRI